ncbi:putative ankyrin repeat-containing domain superfamily [Arabidopsis thaliana]
MNFRIRLQGSFNILTPAKGTVFHLAAEQKNLTAFYFMAESPDRNNLLHQIDRYGNTVLHTAVMSSCYYVSFFLALLISVWKLKKHLGLLNKLSGVD